MGHCERRGHPCHQRAWHDKARQNPEVVVSKAIEKGPFLLLAGLYVSVLCQGLGDTAPFGVTSLLIAGTTLAMFGHLMNVYQVASLTTKYPSIPLLMDLVAIGLLSVMMRFLVFPLSGGYGSVWPFPWVSGEELHRMIAHGVDPAGDPTLDPLEMTRRSLFRFFVVSALQFACLLGWHLVVHRYGLRLRRMKFYLVNWVVFAILILLGCAFTREAPSTQAWHDMIGRLNWLGYGSIIGGAAILFAEHLFDATYEPSTSAPVRPEVGRVS
jgi:hypothetical protein